MELRSAVNLVGVDAVFNNVLLEMRVAVVLAAVAEVAVVVTSFRAALSTAAAVEDSRSFGPATGLRPPTRASTSSLASIDIAATNTEIRMLHQKKVLLLSC